MKNTKKFLLGLEVLIDKIEEYQLGEQGRIGLRFHDITPPKLELVETNIPIQKRKEVQVGNEIQHIYQQSLRESVISFFENYTSVYKSFSQEASEGIYEIYIKKEEAQSYLLSCLRKNQKKQEKLEHKSKNKMKIL